MEMIFKLNTKTDGGRAEGVGLAVVVMSRKCRSSVWVGFGVGENKRLDQRMHTGAGRLEQVVKLVKEI